MRGALAGGGLTVLLLAAAGSGAAEPSAEPGGPAGGRPESALDPVPAVTLDALPLGVPLAALAPAARTRAEDVLAGSVFGHRVSGLRARSREPVFRFLLDHPDFAASVARALRLGEYRVERRDDGFWGDDARGATGTIRILHADDDRRLYHLAGRYAPRRLPPIEGQLLVLLEFRHDDDGAGGSVLDSRVTGHLRIDTPVVGPLAQVVGALARPAVERAVERKVRRFFRTVERVSRLAHDEPEDLLAAVEGHPDVPDGAQLAAFRAILLAGRPPVWADVPFRLREPAEEADD
jgi:hypothetical protein